MSSPRVSILIPTLNGEADLRRLIPALQAQRCPGGFEICVQDSESTDATVELLRAAGARVETIPRARFRHGLVRNLLAARARGEFLIFLSQDCLPAGEDFIEELLEPFVERRVAGVTARILPHPLDDVLTRRTALCLPEASTRPFPRDLDDVAGIWELEAAERVNYLRFNNVASAVRARVMADLPFPEVPFGEDFAWASRVLTAGWRLTTAPASLAYHAHSYGLRPAFERYRLDAAFHVMSHGHRLRPGPWSALRGLCFEVGRDLAFIWSASERPAATLAAAGRSPFLRGAQVLGQLCGSRGWLGGMREAWMGTPEDNGPPPAPRGR
ncbi:MAG: glycosyltransferase [Planctomycetota bacterium]|nr:glycosyltransferase [Planctomycetota bacterium]MDP6954852.1 glycosyltransferase [Planctomycetota bacterium]